MAKIKLRENVAGRKKGTVWETIPSEHGDKHGYFIAYEGSTEHIEYYGFQVQAYQCEVINE